MARSPKSQLHPVISAGATTVDASVKFTHNGEQPERESPLKTEVGISFTVTAVVVVAVHPFASVTVTVYVLLAAGVKFCGLPIILPGIQTMLYTGVPPPAFAVSVTGEPLHTDDGFALACIVSNEGSVTSTFAVSAQLFTSIIMTEYDPAVNPVIVVVVSEVFHR